MLDAIFPEEPFLKLFPDSSEAPPVGTQDPPHPNTFHTRL